MEKIRQIKIEPQIVAKLETLCQSCELQTNDDNVSFLCNYLMRVAMLQLEEISFFVRPKPRPANRPHSE